MATNVSLTLTGFNKLKEKLTPKKFERKLRKHVKKATRRVGLLAVQRVKVDIRKKQVQPSRLSGLTIALKGSTKALVDTGELLKSITSELVTWDMVIVGVLKSRAVRDELTGDVKDVIMLAKILHDGADIPVTPRMRRFFFWLANGVGSPVRGKIHALRSGTKVIHIPARPFMKGVLDKAMRRMYKTEWQAAVNKALAGK